MPCPVFPASGPFPRLSGPGASDGRRLGGADCRGASLGAGRAPGAMLARGGGSGLGRVVVLL